jgi:diguanylate cyclase (GGDEF) domain
MHANENRIKFNETPFLFIDALNCENGCLCGTATDPEKSKTDDALYAALKIRNESKKNSSGNPWSRTDTPEERLESFNKQFENLKLEDYLREYTDRSDECKYDIPTEEEADAIFRSMNKITEESRHIDCTCCGYHRCFEMVTAIHNGFNRKENCIHYEKDMVQKLEVKSSTDLLTGLLNKISFEEEAKRFLKEREDYEKCAVFIFDFDDFKHVNDDFGHKAGDEVLKYFGKLLKKSFRDNDIIGRIGGDEFMAIFAGEISEAGIAARCDNINRVLKDFKYEDVTGLSCSIGVVVDNENTSTFDELYMLADDALYEAKVKGKARFTKWHTMPINKPEKDMIIIVSKDEEFIRKIKDKYGDKYEYYEASSSDTVLNEISLYRNYVKRVFFDFDMPDIAEDVIMEYIKARPMFASVSVNVDN